MLNIGDKLIVTKTVAPFLVEGDIVKVTDVTDEGVISFAFGDDFINMGVMSNNEYEKHFEKIEEEFEENEGLTITQEYVSEIMNNSSFDVSTVFNKCTVVSCKLPNGFVITESSACVNPENYDKNIGMDICMKKIEDKVWELEAYRLQQYLYERNLNDCNCCCDECCNDCEECDEKCDDECYYSDLDCDDCKNYECEFNPHI